MILLRRVLSTIGMVVVFVLSVLGALTILNSPDMEAIFKLLLLLVYGGLAALALAGIIRTAALVLLAVLSVLAMLLVNWPAIFAWLDGALQWLFDPAVREITVVACYDDPGCSGIYPIIYSLVLILVVLTGFAYTTLLERKLLAWLQQRSGPNRVGPAGLLQPLADAIKLIFKEDIAPAQADRAVYLIAPALKAVPVLILFAVLPLGPTIIVPWFAPALGDVWFAVPLGLADPNVGVLWLVAITSLGTYGVVLAGWASASKYAMLGGLRSSAQMISYELSMSLALAVPILLASSLSVTDIVRNQNMIWEWYVFQNPLAAAILLIALLAETNRAPFDLPEAEQELTQGYQTEYSGMKFALFMMAEYLGMIAVSMIAASMFFGGYNDGFGLVQNAPILAPLVLIGKVVLLLMGMIWVRATLPRIRYDRLMSFGWKIMLPLSLVAVSWTAVSVVIGDLLLDPIVYAIVAGIAFVVVMGGALFVLTRSGVLEAEEDDALDPMITGERGGIGYGVLNIVGGILAIPFVLYNQLLRLLDALSNAGDTPSEESTAIEPAGEKQAARPSGSGD